MVEILFDSEVTVRDAALWLPYGAYFRPVIGSDDLSEMAIGPDSLQIIPVGFPYCTTGVNMGKIVSGPRINKSVEREDIEAGGAGSRVSTNFKNYKRTVEFTLISAGRKEIIDLLDDPGPRSSVDSRGGGDMNEIQLYPLVLLFHDEYHPGRFMALYHWAVSFDPVNEEYSPTAPQELQVTAHCYLGEDPAKPGCYREGGTAIWRRVYMTVSGAYMNPETGETPSGVPDYYPALDMADML